MKRIVFLLSLLAAVACTQKSPNIGVTSTSSQASMEPYIEALEKAGVKPAALPVVSTEQEAVAALARIDMPAEFQHHLAQDKDHGQNDHEPHRRVQMIPSNRFPVDDHAHKTDQEIFQIGDQRTHGAVLRPGRSQVFKQQKTAARLE